MCLTSGQDGVTGAAIFEKTDEKMTENEIPYINCVGFGVDNATVNIGKHNSIKTRVLEENPQVYFMGCPCHIFHNTVHSACARFSTGTGFDVDDLDDYFFENNSKRKGVLSKFCEFVDVEYREVLKHINVRWLSLERVVGRRLGHYESLKSYFPSESDSSRRFKRLQKAFSDPMTEVNLMFFHAVMPMFTTPHKMSQRENPCLYIIDEIINS